MPVNLMEKKIENILGRAITDEEMRSVDDFRCLSYDKISDLRKLSKECVFFAIYYLEYIATNRNKEYVNSFVIDIKNGIEQVKDWMKNTIIVVDYDENDIFNLKSVEDMLIVLGSFSDQYGFSKIEFDMDRWNHGSTYIGAPCVRLTEYDYRTKLPHHISIVNDMNIIIKETRNVEITALRWLVSYMARSIWEYLANKEKNKINLIYQYKQKFSDDFKLNPVMRSVIKVLEKELELIGGYYTDEIAPGYTLDDEQVKECL